MLGVCQGPLNTWLDYTLLGLAITSVITAAYIYGVHLLYSFPSSLIESSLYIIINLFWLQS